MTKLELFQVDAFTKTVFAGNPAAVVPLEKWIDDRWMQSIAAENNLSETAFIVQTADGFHIRWFTPASEIDLCGHATLASAYVIKKFIDTSIETIRFSTQEAGQLITYCSGDLFTLDFPARMPVSCDVPSLLTESLRLSGTVEVLKSRDYFVVLENEQAVRNVKPDYSLMKQLDASGVIVTARGDSGDVVSRCFYPALGIDEDPVTGSAHCNIVPYWCGKLGTKKLNARQLSHRGGELICELKGDRVLMSGFCALYLKGEILLTLP